MLAPVARGLVLLVARPLVVLESDDGDRGVLGSVGRVPKLVSRGLEPGHHLLMAAAKLDPGRAERLLAGGVLGGQAAGLSLLVACPPRVLRNGLLGFRQPRGDCIRRLRLALGDRPGVRHRAAGAGELGGGIAQDVDGRFVERGGEPMGDGMLAPCRGRGQLGVRRRPSRARGTLVGALGLRFERARDADGVERGSDRVDRRQGVQLRFERLAPAIDVGDTGIVVCDLVLERGDPFAQLRDPRRPPRLARGGADVPGPVLGPRPRSGPRAKLPSTPTQGPFSCSPRPRHDSRRATTSTATG